MLVYYERYACGLSFCFGLISKRNSTQNPAKIHTDTDIRNSHRKKNTFANDMQTLHKWGLTCFIFVILNISLRTIRKTTKKRKKKNVFVLFGCFGCSQNFSLDCWAKHRSIVNLHNALLFIQALCYESLFLSYASHTEWYLSCLLQFQANNFNFKHA